MNRHFFIEWLIILALSACYANPPATDSVPTIHYYQFSLPGSQKIFAELKERFETEHPGFKVQIHTLPSSTDDQHQFYLTHLAEGGDRLDVFAIDVIWMAEFARAGLLMPVDSLLSEDLWKHYFPSMAEASRYQGLHYAIPYFIDGGLLYSRSDLLKRYGFTRPPATWRELIDISKAVMQGEGNPRLTGFVWQGKQYEGLICNFIEHLPRPLKIEGPQVRLNLPRETLKDAMTRMRDLVYRHRVSPESVFAMAEEESRHSFQNGNAVFMRNWPYAWKLMQQPASPVAGKVWVSLLPGLKKNETGTGTLGGFLLGIHANTPVPEAAKAWVRFLSGEWAQTRLANGLGLTPPRPDWIPARPHDLPKRTLVRVMSATVPRPVTPLYSPLSQTLQAYLSGGLAGIYSPEQALRLMETDLKRYSRILS